MERIFQYNRLTKRVISVSIDSAFILASFWLAFFIRLGEEVNFGEPRYWGLVALLWPLTILANIKLGLYSAVIRYLNSTALTAIISSVAISTTILVFSSVFLSISIPRSVPIIYCAYLLMLVGGSRLLLRSFASSIESKGKAKVLIYGAGNSGMQLVNALKNSGEYKPVAFTDDNNKLHKLTINGLRVYKPHELEKVIRRENIERILLAIPSATRAQRSDIIHRLEPLSIEVLAVPSLADIVSGKAKIDDLVEVSIEDLLGRDQVPPNPDLMHADIKNKVVMVTGAGGSIGSELCRQIINQSPKSLVLLELSEFALYSIHRELEIFIQDKNLNIELYPMMGSVIKKARMTKIMETFKVQTVYHAAAYKHVPLVEHNVIEGIRNNIFGTLHSAQAAIAAKVETFVLISTDKAVRPTNVMGTTKRMAELCLQALAFENSHSTRFCMVRFGNVLGSSGSVVPLFKSQIAKGGPITLTHKDITRYFMTIPEAAQLVIQAGAMGMGGDVFVLDMGEPVKIYDLAYKMIHLSGLHLKHESNPLGDIEIVETGLRPGEKLYEELLIGDGVEKTGHERIMTASEVFLSWDKLSVILDGLEKGSKNFDQEKIRELLLTAPTDFKPTDSICDLLYVNQHK
ncbi:polysaccharide biosynthesis protein [Thalassotalea aquiviva]|uniref:polysaccharide biosynthesis protein n=1 Tax=Thalassotalea aquiviva TaxID=3242415 RepID=UPI00352AFAD1